MDADHTFLGMCKKRLKEGHGLLLVVVHPIRCRRLKSRQFDK